MKQRRGREREEIVMPLFLSHSPTHASDLRIKRKKEKFIIIILFHVFFFSHFSFSLSFFPPTSISPHRQHHFNRAESVELSHRVIVSQAEAIAQSCYHPIQVFISNDSLTRRRRRGGGADEEIILQYLSV